MAAGAGAPSTRRGPDGMRSQMSDTALPTASEETPAARLVSVDIDEWSPAGGSVHIDFSPERTVLVGKNASGKSIVLEGIAGGAASSTDAARVSHGDPHRMCFTLSLSSALISYSYGWVLKEDRDGDYYVSWEERCWRTKADEEIWRVSDSIAHISDSAQMPMPPGTGLLSLRGTPSSPFPPEVEGVRKLLSGVRLVDAGVPRARQTRMATKIPRRRLEERVKGQSSRRLGEHVYEMAFRLVAWFEDRRELFEHFVALARRLGVARRIDVTIESVNASAPYKDVIDSWAMVSFDGVDFGLLSDGTLRLAEILWVWLFCDGWKSRQILLFDDV